MASDKDDFWMTLSLLVGVDWPKPGRDALEDVEEWLDTVVRRRGIDSSLGTPSLLEEVEDDADEFLEVTLPKIDCSFSHPKVRSRLERLMGSNLVRLTDRKYMLRLHDRILEDYIQSMNKRIATREAMERDREKKLVLSGQIPLEQAPLAMANHPILLINAYCDRLIADRRARIKIPRVYIPLYLYLDNTPEPPSGLTIVNGHVFRGAENTFCTPPSAHLSFTDEEDIERGYMFETEEYEARKRYESPEIQELAEVETVEEMYDMAEAIVGPLKTLRDTN